MAAYKYILILLLTFFSICLNAQVVVTKDVDYIRDSEYDNGKDLLDIYMPEGKEEDVPVIVFFHGGALLMGNKSWGENVGLKVAERGIGFISANYRLSPEFQHPIHSRDAAFATAWVIENIEAYGGDPKRVYVAGHSAGAYLASLLALDSSLIQTNLTVENKIKGAILISPFLYVEETAKERIKSDSIYATIWGTNPTDWTQASVTPHILPDRNNIFLLYADGDDYWRKEQNERFASAMTAAGNLRVITKEVQNRTHTSIITGILDEDDMIINSVVDFVSNK